MSNKMILFAVVWLGGLTPSAKASCGAASCALDTYSPYKTLKGDVLLDYTFEYIDQNTPRVGTSRSAVGEITGHHDEERTLSRVHRFSGTVGVTDRLNLDFSLPFTGRAHRHIHNHHTGEVIPEGWNFSGVGDLALQSRYTVVLPENRRRPSVAVIAGVEFPTGKSHVTNSDGDEADAGVTPGSASYDVVVGLSSVQELTTTTLERQEATLPLFLSTTYKINGRGHEDYKLGNTLTVSGGATYPLTSWLGLLTQLNLLVRERDDKGETSEETGKTGGEFLYVSPGIQVQLLKDWKWHTTVQIPVYQRVNQIQLTSDYNLQTGLSYRFKI